MQWSEFNPYVAPYVIGCPDPLIEQHARLAAIEFCRRTSCWQKTLDPVVTDGVSNLVELENETGLQIIKIKAVSVDGRSHPVTDSSNGLKLVRSGSTQNYCFTQDNKSLYISPLQVVSPPASIGFATFTNGSIAVTGTGFLSMYVQAGNYVKLNVDSYSAWARVGSVNSDTSLTLSAAYSGAGGLGAASSSAVKPVSGGRGGVPVVVDAVLAPSRTAATLDDVIGAEYLHDIALGAITSLMRLPKQSWTDYNAAGLYSTQFTSRIATVAAKVSRGFMAQKMRSHASYL